jgi:aquaporin Z
MKDRIGWRFPWQVFSSELIGTALLVLVGLSLVILMFGDGSPIVRIVPSEGARRLMTGFLFGTTGALIALSPVGLETAHKRAPRNVPLAHRDGIVYNVIQSNQEVSP